MSVKNRLSKLEDKIHADNRPLVIAEESLAERGLFEVKDHEALGLLSREDVEAHFDGVVIFIVYVDNWRSENN